MINEISDYFYSFKNKIMEASSISNDCYEVLTDFQNRLENEVKLNDYEENFLTILGYTYRLEDINQRLFFTFQEAVYAIDLDKLMRNEDSMKLNSVVYTLVLNVLIKEFKTNEIDEELKQKALEVYKKVQDRKSKEDTKYHKYQY